jgi:hypothetical protein
LRRIASGEYERVDAVLQRLSPRQLEFEFATTGIRTASEKTRRAALWEHFVQQHRNIAAQRSNAMGRQTDDLGQSPQGFAPDSNAGNGTQLISASWHQHFSSARDNTNPGTHPIYAPQWGHGK